jgi:hypothetical protein
VRFERDLDVLYRWPDEVVHVFGRVVESAEEFRGDVGSEDVCVGGVGGAGYK